MVREKAAAQKLFRAAAAAGHTAGLVDQKHSRQVALSLGNVLAHTTVSLTITYICACPLDERGLSFRVPSQYLLGPIDNVAIMVLIESGGPILGATCAQLPPFVSLVPLTQAELHRARGLPPMPSAPGGPAMKTNVELGGFSGQGRLVEGGDERCCAGYRLSPPMSQDSPSGREWGSDFVLDVRLEDAHAAKALVEFSDVQAKYQGTHGILVSFVPSIPSHLDNEAVTQGEEGKSGNTELVFLVDRSGSMSGSIINEARQTLTELLRNLPLTCRFNIVGFGSTHESLFPGPVDPTPENLRRARDHVRQLKADLGGTELLHPLTSIYQTPMQASSDDEGGCRLRAVFLLTDGKVSQRQKTTLVDLTRSQADDSATRVYTFGIGGNVDRSLCLDLADAGKGTATFIAGAATLKQQVLHTFVHVCEPLLVNMHMDWGALKNVIQVPAILRPVFARERYEVSAIATCKQPFDLLHMCQRVTVVLSGERPVSGERLSFSIVLDLASAQRGMCIHRLVARGLLLDLEEGRNLKFLDASLAKTECVRVGELYGLTSAHTALVAIEKRLSARQRETEQVLSEFPVGLLDIVGEYEEEKLAEYTALNQAQKAKRKQFSNRRSAASEQRQTSEYEDLRTPLLSAQRSGSYSYGSNSEGNRFIANSLLDSLDSHVAPIYMPSSVCLAPAKSSSGFCGPRFCVAIFWRLCLLLGCCVVIGLAVFLGIWFGVLNH